MAKIPPTGVGKTQFYSAQGPLDYREYIDNLEEITSLYSAYVGLEVKCGDGNKYRITEVDLLGHPTQNGYELIQEPKDLKYSDDTSFLNSDNEIDIDTLKLKNIPELQPHPMLDGFYYTISNNTPWEGQILTTPIYHINNQYLEISIPSVSVKPSNLGEFSQSLITAYSELEGKQLEISIFNINKRSNGYLSFNSSYKFKIPLDITSDKTVINTEDGINLECGIGIQTNYQLTIALPENEPNISDYRVVLSFSNIQDVSGKIDKISNSTNGNLPKLDSEGNLVDSGISADSILTKVTGTNLNGKLTTLDTNGNITNSGKSLSDLRAELDNEYVPKPSTDPSDGQILSYDETNETTKWIDNTKVHIKYAATDTPTESQMHNSIQPGDLYIGIYSDNNLSDSTNYSDYEWSKIVGIDGKSAYQQWREAGYTGDETDFLNSLKAHVSRFIPIATVADATSLEVGDTYAFSDVPSPTDGAMLLMPNGASTLMFSVTSNGDIPETFTYTYVGELSISTEGFLSSDKIVNDLTTGGADKVLSAEAGLQIGAKLEGVTASETKMGTFTEHTGQKILRDGEEDSSTLCDTIEVAIPSGCNRIRFAGAIIRNGLINNNSGNIGYSCGYYDNGLWVPIYPATSNWDFNDTNTSAQKEYIIDVPRNATHFRTTSRWGDTLQVGDFYLYFIKGISVADVCEIKKKKVFEEIPMSSFSEQTNMYISAYGNVVSSETDSFFYKQVDKGSYYVEVEPKENWAESTYNIAVVGYKDSVPSVGSRLDYFTSGIININSSEEGSQHKPAPLRFQVDIDKDGILNVYYKPSYSSIRIFRVDEQSTKGAAFYDTYIEEDILTKRNLISTNQENKTNFKTYLLEDGVDYKVIYRTAPGQDFNSIVFYDGNGEILANSGDKNTNSGSNDIEHVMEDLVIPKGARTIKLQYRANNQYKVGTSDLGMAALMKPLQDTPFIPKNELVYCVSKVKDSTIPNGYEQPPQQSLPNTQDIWSAWGFKLPKSYTTKGKPTPLCAYFHGTGGFVTSEILSYSYPYGTKMHNLLLDSGIAVFDVNGRGVSFVKDDSASSPTVKGDRQRHWGNPASLAVAKKAYEVLTNVFNCRKGMVVGGCSMGGCLVEAYCNTYPQDVVAAFASAPALLGLEVRSTAYTGGTDVAVAWGATGDNIGEPSLMIGYSQAIDITEEVVENDMKYLVRRTAREVSLDDFLGSSTKRFLIPFPKEFVIWQGTEDTNVSPERRIGYVRAMRNAGSNVKLRLCEGYPHYLMDFYGEMVDYVKSKLMI